MYDHLEGKLVLLVCTYLYSVKSLLWEDKQQLTETKSLDPPNLHIIPHFQKVSIVGQDATALGDVTKKLQSRKYKPVSVGTGEPVSIVGCKVPKRTSRNSGIQSQKWEPLSKVGYKVKSGNQNQ